MESIDQVLASVKQQLQQVKPADAEDTVRRLLLRLPRHELVRAEPQIRNCISWFLPKRRRTLEEALTAALAPRAAQSAPAPMQIPSTSRVADAARARAQVRPVPIDGPVQRRAAQIRVEFTDGQSTNITALIESVRDEVEPEVRQAAIEALISITSRVSGARLDSAAPTPSLLSSFCSEPSRASVVLAHMAIGIAGIPWLQDENEFRSTVSRLFDDHWNQRVYPSLKMQSGDQTYEKWRAIRTGIAELQDQLRSLSEGLSSLTQFAAVRQEIRKALNSAIARAVVWPLAGREMATVRLEEVLAAVGSYVEATDAAVFEARIHAADVIQDYIGRAADSASPELQGHVSAVAQRLLALMDEHFNNSPVSKSANVSVRPSTKKYPLEFVGTECAIAVNVECEGPGHAFDVEVEYSASGTLRPLLERQYLGNVAPGQVVAGIILPCEILEASAEASISGLVRWSNHSQETIETEFAFQVQGQPTGVDWNARAALDPYSLEPVTSDRDLVGRTEILNQMIAKLGAQAVSSFFVFGQKRVGKTSLVRALESRLRSEASGDLLVIYLDGGDYVHPDAVKTIQRLGTRICEEIKQSASRFASLSIPVFDGALSPIDGFLREVLQIQPGFRLVIILDEFDELPVEIYRRGPVGDAFFLTVRSVSAKPPFGFVLVGGEKMEFILSTQGDALNKFQPLRVDYFDREKQWADFQDLVRQPTAGLLEIADDALVSLYEKSAGNPFFAKLVCDEMYRDVVRRRDAHVTAAEVDLAERRVLGNAGSNRFSHFWEDGIFEESGDKVEERSMARRHLLLALADGLRRKGGANRAEIMAGAQKEGLSESEMSAELTSLERRQVLIQRGDVFTCKVGLFNAWLRDRGVQEIVTTFTDRTSSVLRRAEEERQRITEAELQEVVDRWGQYKGRNVGPETVRAWLAQCGNVSEQKLMFRVLKHLRYYSTSQIRSKMREAHGIVERRMAERNLSHRIAHGQRKRGDILVSHLGGVAKSGVRYGQLYADENGLKTGSVVERDRLGRTLAALSGINALVLVDDMIGSGQSAVEAFKELAEGSREILRRSELVVVYVVVCGFEAGKARVEDELEKLDLPVLVHICDSLTEADRCFSDTSTVFESPADRKRAEDLATALGRRLVKTAPLGYGNCQSLVVFDTNCPNNSLPVLWAEGNDWRPLFKRL